jgi:hypothetical protein
LSGGFAEILILTTIQKDFLMALLSAVVDKRGPVSIAEVQRCHEVSSSRARSCIKALLKKKCLLYVGKAGGIKRFAPSVQAIELVHGEIGDNPKYDDIDALCSCIGGRCQNEGCENLAEDFFRDGYYCRRCIIGHDDETDKADIREQHGLRWGTRTPEFIL